MSKLERAIFISCIFLVSFIFAALCFAEIDNEKLADAIYRAEGVNSRHPYGILAHYKTTTPRQACLNTIKNQKARHAKHDCGKDYLTCLRDRYCPIGARNDPKNSNIHWLKNVKYWYAKLK